MKRFIIFGSVLAVAIITGLNFADISSAQKERFGISVESFRDKDRVQSPEAVVFAEDFPYAVGSLLTANSWDAHSAAGTNALATVAPGLTYAGYPGSGSGNAVAMTTSGEDVNRAYAPQPSGSVYGGVLANLSDASTDPAGGYFFHIGADPVGSAFRCRLFVKKDASNNLSFGISKASTTEITFTPFSYALNTTHLLVVKYTTLAGDANDTVQLFVNPALGGTEPVATVTATDVGASDIVPGTVALRQGSAATAPTLTADAIRIGTAWADLSAGGGGGTPTPTPTATPVGSPTPSPTPTGTPTGTTPRFLFTTRLSGSQEVPANASAGRGFGRVVLNAAENQITASVYWENLGSGTISGHIHTGGVGVNGPVLFNLAPTAGLTSGSAIDRTFAITPAQVADLRAGNMYFNVHTTNFAGGEVRGQIVNTVNDAPLDFNGDGRTDFGVVRPTAALGGTQTRWFNLTNATPQVETQTDFGVITDSVTPGDFDGDGKDDIAIWRSQADNSTFFILQSSTNTLRTVRFGIPNDDPTITADYDGDGIDDPAIFRRGDSDGGQAFFWWFGSFGITKNVQVVVPWGVGVDTAAAGDYNGDGKADFLVYRGVGTPGRGIFFIHYGTGGFDAASPNDTATRFGLPNDAVVPGDYDGDGKNDLALTRIEGNNLVWYYLPSSHPGGASFRLAWGRNGPDVETQGDYDGDGITDRAVWRSSSGNPSVFFILRSSDQAVQYQFWGLFQDFPSAQDSHF